MESAPIISLARKRRIKTLAVRNQGLPKAKSDELVSLATSLGAHIGFLSYARTHEPGCLWSHPLGVGGMGSRTFEARGDCAGDFINSVLARIAEVLP